MTAGEGEGDNEDKGDETDDEDEDETLKDEEKKLIACYCPLPCSKNLLSQIRDPISC